MTICKSVATNLWQSLCPVSQTKVFSKLFDLLVSNTSKRMPSLDLKQVADLTKFERLYVSLRSGKWLFPSHFGSSILMFRFPAITKLSYLLTIWLKLLDISYKNKVLFCFGGLCANKAHHFFLEIFSSIQIVSENLVSRFSNLWVMIPCFT